jgi:predicted regulator of Ras-like GTPase activity (Roadblock/LC7/MglB family)
MADLVLTALTLEKTRSEIDEALIKAGVNTVLLIDGAGNVVASCGYKSSKLDTTSLAALVAANFGASSEIARIIGEEDFSLLFHKGKKDSIHFARVSPDLILITIFGDNVSLGLIRLRVAQLSQAIQTIFEIGQ